MFFSLMIGNKENDKNFVACEMGFFSKAILNKVRIQIVSNYLKHTEYWHEILTEESEAPYQERENIKILNSKIRTIEKLKIERLIAGS